MSRTSGTHELTVSAQANLKPVQYLRALKHLAVVNLDFTISPFYPDEASTVGSKLYKVQAERDLEIWKTHLVEVLKDSPSKERKFLRWRISKGQRHHDFPGGVQVVMGEGKLEVIPETPL